MKRKRDIVNVLLDTKLQFNLAICGIIFRDFVPRQQACLMRDQLWCAQWRLSKQPCFSNNNYKHLWRHFTAWFVTIWGRNSLPCSLLPFRYAWIRRSFKNSRNLPFNLLFTVDAQTILNWWSFTLALLALRNKTNSRSTCCIVLTFHERTS